MAETIVWSQLAEQAGDVATSFDALPVGVYSLEVVDATYKETSTGKKAWNIQTKVLDEGQYKNRRLFDYVVLTTDNAQALGFFFQKMSVMGLPKTFFATSPGISASNEVSTQLHFSWAALQMALPRSISKPSSSPALPRKNRKSCLESSCPVWFHPLSSTLLHTETISYLRPVQQEEDPLST